MTTHVTLGYVLLDNVTFTGTEGQPGSQLSWSGFNGGSSNNILINDQDSDGNLDAGSDFFDTGAFTFTGYTITVGGLEYGIYEGGGQYRVPINEDGNMNGDGSFDQTTIPMSGTTNIYQAETTGPVYLCFVGGTWIATPNGETRVEELAIGDLVTTADGRYVPVRWIGRQIVKPMFANVAMDEKRTPVCIAKGALESAPNVDLYVSADHGMIVDGLVINASALVKGDTMRFVPASEMPSEFTYYHIETEAHDVILANGAASETFIDAAGRATFHNYQEYLDLYGAERIIPEMNRPRISSQRLVPQAIKMRLGLSDTSFVAFALTA